MDRIISMRMWSACTRYEQGQYLFVRHIKDKIYKM